MTGSLRAVRRILVASVTESPDLDAVRRDRRAVDDAALVDAATYHRVGPAVDLLLRAAGVDGPRELSLQRQQQMAEHLRALAAIAGLGRLFGAAGVPWLTFKGPVLAEAYPRPDARVYGDLDVLVDRRMLGTVIEVLEGDGATPIDRNWAMIERQDRGEMSLALPSGVPLDLHWALVNDRELRAELGFPVAQVLGRRTDVRLGSVTAPTMVTPDHLVYVAMHAALAGGHRLVWIADIDRLARACAPAWDEVVASARAARLEVLVGTMLAQARRLLGTPVPDAVVRELAPAWGWRGVVALLDRARPVDSSFQPGFTGQTVRRSTRGSTRESVRALARQVRRWSATRALQADRDAVPAINPLYLESADPAVRARFLDRLTGDDATAR